MTAAFDYAALQETALQLIKRFGRPATLERAARVTSATVDPTKRWQAPQGDADPDTAQAQSIPITGVFLSLDRRNRDGQVVEAKTQEILIGAEEAIPEQLGPGWELVDLNGPTGPRAWGAIRSQPLQPGPVLMLSKLLITL